MIQARNEAFLTSGIPGESAGSTVAADPCMPCSAPAPQPALQPPHQADDGRRLLGRWCVLALHQPAADQIGGDELGGASEEAGGKGGEAGGNDRNGQTRRPPLSSRGW